MSTVEMDGIWLQAEDRLRSLASLHRLREDLVCTLPDGASSARREIDGEVLLNFSSNDYLDLAQHPEVKQGAIDAVKEYGSGSMASRLVCGTLPIHWELEAGLADLKGSESALVFSSGYMACLGVVQALSRRSDDSPVQVLFDRLVHASLVDGATQERRRWRSFPHNDLNSLELLLKKVKHTQWPSAVVLTEGVFSMDGDVPPLKAMAELCAKYRAFIVVDDAHGTGTMGPGGAGTLAQVGIADQPHVVQVGTLSKALGAQGGFVAGPKVLRDLMVNSARSFIYDTGLAPANCGAALAALSVMKREPQRLERLRENVKLLRDMLHRTGCEHEAFSPIVPIIMGEEQKALTGSEYMRKKGFLVSAIRPPTVAAGTSRLRITLSAAHDLSDVRKLGQAISTLETA